jgi:hypothetical protein
MEAMRKTESRWIGLDVAVPGRQPGRATDVPPLDVVGHDGAQALEARRIEPSHARSTVRGEQTHR